MKQLVLATTATLVIVSLVASVYAAETSIGKPRRLGGVTPGETEYKAFDLRLARKIAQRQKLMNSALQRHTFQHQALNSKVQRLFLRWKYRVRWFRKAFKKLRAETQIHMDDARRQYREEVWAARKEASARPWASEEARGAWVRARKSALKLKFTRRARWLKQHYLVARKLLWQRYVVARKTFLARMRSQHTKLKFMMERHTAEIGRHRDHVQILERFRLQNSQHHQYWRKRYFSERKRWKEQKITFERKLGEEKKFRALMHTNYKSWRRALGKAQQQKEGKLRSKWLNEAARRKKAYKDTVLRMKAKNVSETNNLKAQAQRRYMKLEERLKRTHSKRLARYVFKLKQREIWLANHRQRMQGVSLRLRRRYKRRIARLKWWYRKMRTWKGRRASKRKARWAGLKAQWLPQLRELQWSCYKEWKARMKRLAQLKRRVVRKWIASNQRHHAERLAFWKDVKQRYEEQKKHAQQYLDSANQKFSRRVRRNHKKAVKAESGYNHKMKLLQEERPPEGLSPSEEQEWLSVKKSHVDELRTQYEKEKHQREVLQKQNRLKWEAERKTAEEKVSQLQKNHEQWMEQQRQDESKKEQARAAQLTARKHALNLKWRQRKMKVNMKRKECRQQYQEKKAQWLKAKSEFKDAENKKLAEEKAWWAAHFKSYIQRLQELKNRRAAYKAEQNKVKAKWRAEYLRRKAAWKQEEERDRQLRSQLRAKRKEKYAQLKKNAQAEEKKEIERENAERLAAEARAAAARQDSIAAKKALAHAALARKIEEKKLKAEQELESSAAKTLQARSDADRKEAERIKAKLAALKRKEQKFVEKQKAAAQAEEDEARKRMLAAKAAERRRAAAANDALVRKAKADAQRSADLLRAERIRLEKINAEKALQIDYKQRANREKRFRWKMDQVRKRWRAIWMARKAAMAAYWKKHSQEAVAERYRRRIARAEKRNQKRIARFKARQQRREARARRRAAKKRRKVERHGKWLTRHRQWLRKHRTWVRMQAARAEQRRQSDAKLEAEQRLEKNQLLWQRQQTREQRAADRRKSIDLLRAQQDERLHEHKARVAALRQIRMELRTHIRTLRNLRLELDRVLAQRLIISHKVNVNDTQENRLEHARIEAERILLMSNITREKSSVRSLRAIVNNQTASVAELTGQIRLFHEELVRLGVANADDFKQAIHDSKHRFSGSRDQQLSVDEVTKMIQAKDLEAQQKAKEAAVAEKRTRELEIQEMKRQASRKATKVARDMYKKYLNTHLAKLKKQLKIRGQKLRQALSTKANAEVAQQKKQLEDDYNKKKHELRNFLRQRARRWLWSSLRDFGRVRKTWQKWQAFQLKWRESYKRQCGHADLTDEEKDECAFAQHKFRKAKAKSQEMIESHSDKTFERIRDRLHGSFNPTRDEKEKLAEQALATRNQDVKSKLSNMYEGSINIQSTKEKELAMERRRRIKLSSFFNTRSEHWKTQYETQTQRRLAEVKQQEAALAAVSPALTSTNATNVEATQAILTSTVPKL